MFSTMKIAIFRSLMNTSKVDLAKTKRIVLPHFEGISFGQSTVVRTFIAVHWPNSEPNSWCYCISFGTLLNLQ